MVTHRVYGRQNASAKGNLVHERIRRETKGKHALLNEQQPLSTAFDFPDFIGSS